MAAFIDQNLASHLIREVYWALLEREADELGLVDKVRRLVAGDAQMSDIVREFVLSPEFISRVPGMLQRRGVDAGMRLTNDVSQHGEIWMLLRTWVNEQAHYGIVVDIGARGRERSNSYDLMRHFGWRGLLVEANADLVDSIRRDFAGLDMMLACCAISNYEGRAIFTLGANDDVSSLDASAAAGWGGTRGQVEVDVRRLPLLLAEHSVPFDFDLLSLDIEGEDIKVLNDLVEGSAYRPRWVIIEASHDFKVRSLEDAPFSSGVRGDYYVRAATCANLILARRYPQRDAWVVRREDPRIRETR